MIKRKKKVGNSESSTEKGSSSSTTSVAPFASRSTCTWQVSPSGSGVTSGAEECPYFSLHKGKMEGFLKHAPTLVVYKLNILKYHETTCLFYLYNFIPATLFKAQLCFSGAPLTFTMAPGSSASPRSPRIRTAAPSVSQEGTWHPMNGGYIG